MKRSRSFALLVVVATLALALPATAVPLDPNGTFIDDDGTVYEPAIEAIADADITRGCNPPLNDEYCPSDAVIREQMATFLVRALALVGPVPAPTEDHFTDDDGSVHENDTNVLAELGVARGCNPPDNDEFCPNEDMTRGQMAAMLTRAFGYSDADPSDDRFTDDDGSVFEGDIEALASAGVTVGCNPPDNDEFCPNESVTRAQMALFLSRALGLAELPPPSVDEAELVRPFFLLDQPEDGPFLASVARYVEPGTATPETALIELLEGPTDAKDAQTPAFSTEIPFGTTLNDVAVAGGVATVDLSTEFDDGGGSATMFARLAQLTFTLVEFDAVDEVQLELDGTPVDTFSSEGIEIGDGLDAAYFTDNDSGLGVLAEHFPTSPAWYEFVDSPIAVEGWSRAFEATIQWQLFDDDGMLITEGFETTGSGGPTWGPMEFEIEYEIDRAQLGTLTIFESSAKDGSPTDIRETAVWLQP
jgi:Immunoglobulin-like domain of bacterial spore germination/Sporulation and spore germination/S-layer homology domain